jgi:hypothetical protein
MPTEAHMKTLLLLPLFLVFVSPGQNPTAPQEVPSVTVLGFKWSRTHQNVKTQDPSATARVGPAQEMTVADKVLQRNARANNPVGAPDPDETTIDARSAAIEKAVQESRTPSARPTEGFGYLVKVQNTGNKVIDFLFWEYQFIDPSNPENVTRRQFLCAVKIKPDKEKELQAFGVSGPSEVISVKTLANPSAKPFQEKVVINRVEYTDGSVWQRRDWNSNEIKLTFKRAMATPWDPGEMCRGL